MAEGEAKHSSDQAEAMTRAWTEAQQEIWGSWHELLRSAPRAGANTLTASLAEQWRALAAQGLEAWVLGSGPTARTVAERLFTVQETLTRFLELSTSSWKTIAPRAEAGEDWQSLLSDYADRLRQRLVQAPEELSEATQNVGELWRLYLEQMQKLGQPWVEALRSSPGQLSQAAAGGNRSELIEMTSLHWDAYERTFGRLLETPSLGFSRELNEKLIRGFDAWMDFRRANFDYQVVVADAWARAFERFIREQVARAEQGKTEQSLRELLVIWGDVVDAVLDEMFRSEEYNRAQANLINSGMAYRKRERECTEALLKGSHLPTRGEVDDAYRTIYQLRKDVSALKKALRQLQPAQSPRSKVQSGSKVQSPRSKVRGSRSEVRGPRSGQPLAAASRDGASQTRRLPRNTGKAKSASRRPTAAKGTGKV